MPIIEGPKIWVESLLSPKEWAETAAKFPKMFHRKKPYPEFECEYKWRKGMGSVVPKDERDRVNAGIEKLREIITEQSLST